MLTTGTSCIKLTATIVSIAIITVKASDAGAQQIILNGFGNGFGSMWLVPAAIPVSKSISHSISMIISFYFPPAISDSLSVASTLIARLL